MSVIRYCATLAYLVLCGISFSNAQQGAAVVEKFPVGYGPTNIGRDFWLAFPANLDAPGSAANYVRLYITSTVRTQVRVWTGSAIRHIIYTIPNDIVKVDLTPLEAQMFQYNGTPPVPADRVFKKSAIHIQAAAPIAVYAVNQRSSTAEGLLALPANALGREYVVASFPAVTDPGLQPPEEFPSQYMIVAPYNGTRVTITHPHRTPNHQAGETFTVDLDSGDVFSAMTSGSGGDMSGVVIRSNKPVAVTAGQSCTFAPALPRKFMCCCNHTTEMMLPTSGWGKFYHVIPMATPQRGNFYRIFAREPNTTVYVNGAKTGELNSVGGEDGMGWFEYRAQSGALMDISADKPIYVLQYKTSQKYDSTNTDPIYQALMPLEHYRTELMFSTPAGDFTNNYLNLACDSAGFYNMEITRADREEWQPVWKLPNSRAGEKFPSLVDGRRYLGISVEIGQGVYRLRSTHPVGGTIHGVTTFGYYGYAYPLAASARDLASPDKMAPIITKTQNCNGSVSATVSDDPDDNAVRTNLSTIELVSDPAVTYNYELQVTPFEAGMARQTAYRLEVLDKSRPARAVIVASDMAGNLTYDTVVFDLAAITFSSPADYGKVRAGEKRTRSVLLTNEMDDPAEIQGILLDDGAQGFEILSPKGAVVLGPKGSPTAAVAVEVEYTASIQGQRTSQVYEDFLGIRQDCGVRLLGILRAQVVKPMILVNDNDFGRQPAGTTTGIREMEVRNASTIEGSTLTITGVRGPQQPGIFAVQAPAFPFTLAPGETRTLQVQATPPGTGIYRDTIFFESDAMDIAEGDAYGWLQVEGSGPASVDERESLSSIRAIEITPHPVERDEAMLKYRLERRGLVTITVADAGGGEVRMVEQGTMRDAGAQSVRLDLKGLPAGTYFARITAGGESISQRLVIVR